VIAIATNYATDDERRRLVKRQTDDRVGRPDSSEFVADEKRLIVLRSTPAQRDLLPEVFDTIHFHCQRRAKFGENFSEPYTQRRVRVEYSPTSHTRRDPNPLLADSERHNPPPLGRSTLARPRNNSHRTDRPTTYTRSDAKIDIKQSSSRRRLLRRRHSVARKRPPLDVGRPPGSSSKSELCVIRRRKCRPA